MRTKYWALPACGLVLITACGPKKPGPDTGPKDTLATGEERYIPFKDAENFLPSWSKDNIVINQWSGEPLTLHPTNENNAGRHFVANYTQSTLLTLNLQTLELEPDVAASLPTVSADGLTYEYTIRPEAKWDDGSPVTAEDVIFTYKANVCLLVANPFAKPYLEGLQDIIADPSDNHKVKFVMKYKYILNDYLTTDFALMQRAYYDPNNVVSKYSFAELTDGKMATSPPKDIADWANEFNGPRYGSEVEHLAGLGPYKVESWERGQTMVLVKKQNHWTTKLANPILKHHAYPEKIYFKLIMDENALAIELKKQGIDVSTYLSTKGLQDLAKDTGFVKNYNHAFVDAFSLALVHMNCRPDGVKRKKLFVDKNVRRAMALLTPMDDIIQVVYYGKAKRLMGPVISSKKDFNTALQPVPYDLNQAKQLLETAGWKDTDGDNILDKVIDGQKVKFEFELTYQSNSPVTKDIADLMAEAMMKVGVKVNHSGTDVTKIMQMGSSHDFDMIFTAFGGSSVPDDFKQLWHTQSWEDKGSNFSGFGNEASDALIDSIRHELDESKRIAMSQRFQKMVYDEQPAIFLLSTYRKVAIHRRFGNAAGYYEKPGVSLNNLKLLYGGVIQNSETAGQ